MYLANATRSGLDATGRYMAVDAECKDRLVVKCIRQRPSPSVYVAMLVFGTFAWVLVSIFAAIVGNTSYYCSEWRWFSALTT